MTIVVYNREGAAAGEDEDENEEDRMRICSAADPLGGPDRRHCLRQH